MMTPSPHTDDTVDVRWIAEHVGDPRVRLVEADVSRASYDHGHIPGAVLWNAYVDLRDSNYRPVSLPELQRLFSHSGIAPMTTVVFYGYAAPLGFWLMRAHGHGDARLLMGPRDQWIESGEQWSTDVPCPGDSPYPAPREHDDILASGHAVKRAVGDPGQLILDVRSEAEYAGERFWPSGATEDAGRAGHVPGAVNVPIDSLRLENGAPRSAEELQRVFEAAGVTKHRPIITYCTIGNRASEAWFDLRHVLGYPSVRVYYDSWVVWGKSMTTPVAA
jgi:thiosulfate/3-mercaptopyruvate sulfurtransferase